MFTSLAQFSVVPASGLVQGTDGNFYGTTQGGTINGSNYGNGTVFKMTPGGALTTVYTFSGNDGQYPAAGLIQGTDGNFYGTTSAGGTNGKGTVFKITPAGALTTLYSFAGSDGRSPQAALIQAADGSFYGTTYYGGVGDAGTLFKITPGGSLTTLYSFAGSGGYNPQAPPLQAFNGSFYGTTMNGGTGGLGTVFNVATTTPLSIFGLSPNEAIADTPAFTLTVNGADFVTGSTVLWNGGPLTTTYMNGSQLTAFVPAGLIASSGTATVAVQNPGGATSNSVTFTIYPAQLSVTTLNPSSATPGGAAFTLMVNGSGFIPASVVSWNGSPLTTAYVSATQLTANVPASLIASQSVANVSVQSAGTVSNVVSFVIGTPPALVISSLSPSSVVAGSSTFTLTVNGSGFLSSSVVQWNGSPLSTTYVSGTQLMASVPANLIASQATASITVGDPTGQNSNVVSLAIGIAPVVISSLSPNSVGAGSAGFTLTVNGSGFAANAVVVWNGSPLVTAFVNSNQLTASVPANLIATQGSASLAVENPGGMTSNGGTFSISAPGSVFVPVTPCRVVDTRNPAAPFGGPSIGAMSTRSFAIPSGPCAIPSSATAYSLSVAVVPHATLGYLTLYPAGEPQPFVSTVNSPDGRIKDNAAIVPAGTNGAVNVYATDATDVILDINGYFVPVGSNAGALSFYPLTPCRVADTR
ncbi:MAG: hypothetical protein JO099_03595, partial [Acidobacteriia bacterium]|nr:hypothetical protein [Terriglobia bacterium]